MAGVVLTKEAVNSMVGSIAAQLHTTIGRAVQFKYWLDGQVDQDLINLGFTQAEVNIIRSAVGDMDQLATIYKGGAALLVAKDFRAFVKLLYGFGI